MRHPAGLDYPQPTDLHMKLTSETYIGSLQRPLSSAAVQPTARGTSAIQGARRRRLAHGGTGIRQTAPTRNGRGSGASISREIWPIGHDRRNAVKHVLQACFELPFPEVLGQSCCKAVHRRETPGVDLVRGIEQLTRAVGVLNGLPLLSRAGWAQAARNRVGGCASGRSATIRDSVGTGEGPVARLGVPERHSAGFQEQVTKQEAIERAVGE